MLNALWLVPIVIWLAWGRAEAESSSLDVLYFGLTALFWIGHRVCSTWLAYCTEAYRPLLRTRPASLIVIPLLVTIGCFAALLPSDDAVPWTRDQRVVVLAILDYALVTYHFAAQHFGALSLYRTRVGRAASPWTRRMDRLFALGVGGVLVFLADILAGSVAFHDAWVDRWFLPDSIAAGQHEIRIGAILVLVAATSVMLLAEARAERPSLPRVLYVLGIAGMIAIALQPRSVFLFLVIWTSQHWILATGLASVTPSGEPAPARDGILRRLLHGLNRRPWAIVLLLMALSVVLLPFFEVEGNRDGGTYYGDRIFGALATGLRTSTWVPALMALGFATGFIHYLLDRNVYRMSDPRVRAAACGLLAHRAPSARAGALNVGRREGRVIRGPRADPPVRRRSSAARRRAHGSGDRNS
jgi:hypothetical protein